MAPYQLTGEGADRLAINLKNLGNSYKSALWGYCYFTEPPNCSQLNQAHPDSDNPNRIRVTTQHRSTFQLFLHTVLLLQLYLTNAYTGQHPRYNQAPGLPPPLRKSRQQLFGPQQLILPGLSLLPKNQALVPFSLTPPWIDPLRGATLIAIMFRSPLPWCWPITSVEAI